MRRLPIYFLLDTDVNISEKIKVNYATVLNSIIKKLRVGFREFERDKLTIDLNIIKISDECKIIISKHSIDDELNLKLTFDGQSNYLKAIDFLKKTIAKNVNEFYYTPIIISFFTKSIDENVINLFKRLNFDFGVGNSHPDYCEIFINQYIDYNYIVLFNDNITNIFSNFCCTIINNKDVDEYNFRGEIKDNESINLIKQTKQTT